MAQRSPRKNGVIIVQMTVTSVAFALANLQARGELFVGPQLKCYKGQIMGLHSRDNDLVVNPAKGKLTNIKMVRIFSG